MPTLDLQFPLEQSEDNIVTRIKSQVTYFDLAVPTVAPLGSMSDDMVVLKLKQGPAIFVVYENDHMAQEPGLVGDVFQQGWRIWRVLVICTSMRGQQTARRGDLGAYQLSDAVKRFLVGYDPVNDVIGEGQSSYPLLYLGRNNAPSDDLADYLMMMRFAHPLEAELETL